VILHQIDDILDGDAEQRFPKPISRREINEICRREDVMPKVAVSAVMFNSDKEVLLVKGKDSIWLLPGGYADVGPGPIRKVSKEVKEETALDIPVETIIGIYDYSLSSS
jgi:8-oxo-dGTP pyrophosphatase MutT (NUDIX family)